jgi:hypothetical protein
VIKRFIVPGVVLLFALACIGGPVTLPPTSVPPTAVPVTAVPDVTLTPTIDPSHLAHLPNPALTPGDVLPVTVSDICVSGYSSKVRNVTDAVKNQVYLEYGIPSHQPYEYEVDHLISLELGGSNSVKNLWPEPYAGDWNARVKDKIENKLHALVCDGQLDLQTAQHEIATDWMTAYLQYIGQP